jgi:hypothetical protein
MEAPILTRTCDLQDLTRVATGWVAARKFWMERIVLGALDPSFSYPAPFLAIGALAPNGRGHVSDAPSCQSYQELQGPL